MRENRLYGSEGGEVTPSRPLSNEFFLRQIQRQNHSSIVIHLYVRSHERDDTDVVFAFGASRRLRREDIQSVYMMSELFFSAQPTEGRTMHQVGGTVSPSYLMHGALYSLGSQRVYPLMRE